VLVPVRKPARGELDINAKTRNALLRPLLYQGERGFALMSQRWRALQHVMISPGTIGSITKAALVWCYSSTRCSPEVTEKTSMARRAAGMRPAVSHEASGDTGRRGREHCQATGY
jgi:hypothetical protein